MRLICPNCVAQYEVDEGIIPPEGRDVQCANCGHNWFQDALQMLATDVDMKTGTGDPDSDVSAELFNDLEGTIDHQTSNTPAQEPLPDPNDILPEDVAPTAERDEPPMPSSRLDQDVLDVLRSEAEYSSGEKPPAAEQDAPSVQKPATDTAMPPPEDTKDDVTEDTDDDGDDGLDEIRRRTMEMETAVEEQTDQAPAPELDATPEPEPVPEPTSEPVEVITPDPDQDFEYATEPQKAPDNGNPFSRPARNGARNTGRDALRIDREYEENMPLEKTATAQTPDQSPIIENEDIVIADETETTSGSGSPFRKLKTDSGPDQPDDLYGASNDENIPRKDMFPDIDKLSSEIASEAENTKYDHEPVVDQTEKTKGGFFKGLVYALLIYGVIAALYTMKASIIKFLPQSEGLLGMLSKAVDKMIDLLGPLVDMVKGMIG